MPIRLTWTTLPPDLRRASPREQAAFWLASGLGTGLCPASGTCGALLAWMAHQFLFPQAFTPEQGMIALLLLIACIIVGTWAADVAEKLTGVKDDSRITVDEVVGYFVAVMYLPSGWRYTLPAFVLCRLLDILKPPPARQLQDLHGGVGIMVDDLISSLYACLLMHAALWFLG